MATSTGESKVLGGAPASSDACIVRADEGDEEDEVRRGALSALRVMCAAATAVARACEAACVAALAAFIATA